MKGINKAIILGRCGKDPEIRFTANQKAVATLSLATSEQWKDKQTGEKQERAEWHRVVLFDKLAEIVQQYVKKGDLLYIEGKIVTRKWEDKNGKTQYTTEIVANELQMIGSNNSQLKEGNINNDLQRKTVKKQSNNQGPDESELDEDIPF